MLSLATITALVGALSLLFLLLQLCAGKRAAPEAPSASKDKDKDEAVLDPHEELVRRRRREDRPLSGLAHELKVMLGLPESRASVTIAVDMEKIYDPCYKGIDEAVSALSEFCLVYLLVLVQSFTDREQEHRTKEVLARLPLSRLPAHRVLHHETAAGKIAFVRQIKPYLHVETEEDAYQSLRPHVPLVIFHERNAAALSSTHTHQIESFAELTEIELKI